jgi:hypothetical protein
MFQTKNEMTLALSATGLFTSATTNHSENQGTFIPVDPMQ